MLRYARLPWIKADHEPCPALEAEQVLALSPGDPWGHALAICHAFGELESAPRCSRFDPGQSRFVDGPLVGRRPEEIVEGHHAPRLPLLLDANGKTILCDDPLSLAQALAPSLFEGLDRATIVALRQDLLDAVYHLGQVDEQGAYEAAHAQLARRLEGLDGQLAQRRFLGGGAPTFTDVMLFTFSVRLDPVYYELYHCSVGLLEDFAQLQDHARDLFELPAFFETTDFEAIKAQHYLHASTLNPRAIIAAGGLPDLDGPQFRAEQFARREREAGTEEDQQRARAQGEWVRPTSEERGWIRADGQGEYPAQAGRYHLFAPYNCPWSHRALLARAVKGLEEVVGASIVYFRRDPDRGWQFNAAIPGCTEDLEGGRDYVVELYESVGSQERSVPLLWDSESETIVSNESAEILRMFNDAFGEMAARAIDLYPEGYRVEIDRINEAVYQRINNGAYKAGFARSQSAYERAFARYFRALRWLDEDVLAQQDWLAGTSAPTEADLRLFPTLFRHDAVYYARFKLNAHRLSRYRRLSRWLERMMELPGVAQASNLDHARNGYFGRTGNEIVPAGPVPLGLSRKDFEDEVWLNER